MADVFSAIIEDGNLSDYWDGDIEWAFDAESNKFNPTAHIDETARDAQYGTRIFGDVNEWEAVRDGVANSVDTEYAVIQAPWDADDTNIVDLTFTNTPTIVIKTIGSARNQTGIWDDGADSPHRIVADSDANGIIKFSESDVTVDGVQTHNTRVDDTSSYNFIIVGAHTGINIKNCIVNTTNAGIGIYFSNSAITADVWNNTVYNPHGVGASSEGIYVFNCDTVNIFNCTVDKFNDGIEIDAAATGVTLKNNAVFNNTTDLDDAVGATTNKNASDDAFGTNPVTLRSAGNYSAEFTDQANNNYSVKDASSRLYDAAEADVFADDNDIIGTSRPQSTSWDIGAFELIVAAGGNAPTGTIYGPLVGPMGGPV